MFFISIWFGFSLVILKHNITSRLDKTICTVFRMCCPFKCLLSKQNFTPAFFSFPNALIKLHFFLAEERGRAFLTPLLRWHLESFVQMRKTDANYFFWENYIEIIKSNWKLSFPSRNSKENWSQLMLVKLYRKLNGETPCKLFNDLQILWGLSVEKCKFISTLAFHSSDRKAVCRNEATSFLSCLFSQKCAICLSIFFSALK